MRNIIIDNTLLVEDKKSTYLTADVASASSTLTVKSIVGFAINKILLIGELGSENSEIIKTHTATAPTGSTITLVANTTFAHSAGDKVYIIDYDQVEASWSATTTGTKTVLATLALQPDQRETQYTDTTKATGYYFSRFKETIDSTFSSYSDALPFGGWATNQVGQTIKYALQRNKLDDFTDNVTHDFCIEEITSCLNYITGKLKRWSDLQKFDQILGQTARGQYKFALPSDLYDQNTNRSVLQVKINDQELIYKDKREFDDDMSSVIHTQVKTEGAVGATSLVLDNAYDLNSSGTLNIYISNTLYSITYTGITRSTGTITGIPASSTGSITATIPVDTDVWQGESEGQPLNYTIYEGYLYIGSDLPSATYKDLNVDIDYYTAITSVDSDADVLDVARYDAIKYWLTSAVRDQLKNDGVKNLKDNDYIMFELILRDFIRTTIPAQGNKMSPNVRGITY